MATKNPKPKKTKPEPEPSDEDGELIDDPKMDLGDQWGMKRMLDEKAMQVLEDLGYPTDWRVWNLKMVLGTISCICAGIAQLWPGEYPETKVVLMVCCGIYYACAVWLQYIASFVECGWFVFTNAKPSASWSKETGIALTSYMERYDYEYTLCVEVRPGSGVENPKEEVKLVKGLNEYFDSDGYLAHEIFERDIERLVKRFEDTMAKETGAAEQEDAPEKEEKTE
jgi:hypothetical protein